MENEPIVGAVRMLRDIRDRINREIAGMTFEQRQQWMEEQLARAQDPPTPVELREKAR